MVWWLGLCLCVSLCLADNVPILIFNTTYSLGTGARCLDGSPSGYGRAATTPTSKNSWVFFLQGGGLCYTADTCAERSKTALGSSTHWPKSVNSANSIISSDPANPFSTWNRIYIPYCGGDTHVGTNVKPNANGFYFAGHLTLQAVVDHLKENSDIYAATEIIVSGSSAGGIGTFNNADWFAAQFPNAVVKAIPFAGYFFSPTAVPYPEWIVGVDTPIAPEATQMLQAFYKNIYVNTNCAEAFPGATYRCWWAGTVYPYIKTPLLLVNNIYDTSQMANMLFKSDGTQNSLNYRGFWGNDVLDGFTSMAANKDKDGYYFPSCNKHGENFCMKTLMKVNGYTVADVIGNWFFETGKVPTRLIDSCWKRNATQPCNPTCHC